MQTRHTPHHVLLFILAFIVPLSGQAQSYPVKPVRVVAPYPPGSSADVMGRIYAPKLTEFLGRPFIVDNRPGAAGNIAGELVARANPDGYTLLLLNTPLASSVSLYKEMKYDVGRDFRPAAMLGIAPYLLVVNSSSPATSMKELIAMAKASPGKLNYASTGTGGGLHLTMELFKMQTGTNMLHVPYKGSSATVPDLIAGRVDTMFGSIPALLPHVRSGRIRALGVTSAKRSMVIADIPTLSELGLPGFEASTWVSLAAPAGTPPGVATTLNVAVNKSAQTPEISKALANQSTDIMLLTPQQTAAFIQDEIVKWKKVVAAAGVQPE